MSMTRTDALTQLARGLQKFEGATAGQVLESGWAGLKGLHSKDLAFFRAHADEPVTAVASACHDRGEANPAPAVGKSDTIIITAPAGTKARWVHQAQSESAKLSDFVFSGVEKNVIEASVAEIGNIAEQIVDTPVYFSSKQTREGIEAMIQAAASFKNASNDAGKSDAALWLGEAYLIFSASLPDTGLGEKSTSWATANQIAKILGGPAMWEQRIKKVFA